MAIVYSFYRAAQKLNLSSKKKRKQEEPLPPPAPDPPPFPTNFSDIIRLSPPPPPPSLLKNVGRVKENPGVGKVCLFLSSFSFYSGAKYYMVRSI